MIETSKRLLKPLLKIQKKGATKMEGIVKAEQGVSILQETVQKDQDEFEARADCEEAKAERERISGQIAKLLRQGATLIGLEDID